MLIEIVNRPTGEAPDWVRDAWIGLHIPLKEENTITAETFNAGNAPRTQLGFVIARLMGRSELKTGYVVSSKTAVEILAASHIKAAEWWVDNVPNILHPEMIFIFNEQACARKTA